MTRQRFSSLSKKAKKSALLRSGAFLAERKLGFLRVMLYQVDNFYTEVYFFKATKNLIGFRSFFSTNKLNPYLHQIDLSGIVKEVTY